MQRYERTGRTRLLAATIAGTLGLAVALPAVGEEMSPVSPDLTPKLRDLLRQEMQSIEQASKDILSALIAGDDARVADLAQQIHDSFILQQSMTPEDKQDLMAAVPENFVARDKAFHRLSADLAQAGRDGDRGAQHAEFGRMIEACTACHARYATDRFPMLAE
ncbi:cytochrome c [Roseovarius sp. SCSIO 43702]|uniref:cytochrome c n=1 Tax=Roseovarius sp. SCSIO 43702 TaxID=2823043 RepID=UPI001C732CAB|nr:cytochrome c [Roseovarius sp. SCSIO 43702]QYX56808.1 cytochrome c [Roseovarius sp. SCSIO 43702]